MNIDPGAIYRGCAAGCKNIATKPPFSDTRRLLVREIPWRFLVFSCLLLSLPAAFAAPGNIDPRGLREIDLLFAEKRSWTPTQLKLESQLIHALKRSRNESFAPGLSQYEQETATGLLLVDIDAVVSPELLTLIERRGQVISSFPQWHAVRALVPVPQLDILAASPDVRFIRRADQASTSAGPVNSEGDIAHRAAAARAAFGVSGAGIKIGVLSDSVDFLTESQAAGELGTVTVLPGQAGSGSGEGTAMLEIIHDLAPSAQLYFATGLGGQSTLAANILNLRSNGCHIIVDDIYYFNEPPFQDGLVAQAINTVTANGALYFTAGGNSGNLDAGTSGTWEGDFVDGGAVSSPLPGTGQVHNFGSLNYNTVLTGGSDRHVELFWSDPLSVSTNDYDVFVLNSTGTAVLRSSMTRQIGAQDPFEFIAALNPGERIVVVKFSGAARFLHLGTGRARLSHGTSGAITGHPGAANAITLGAVDAVSAVGSAFTGGTANPVELFSSDGPRRIFYQPNGTAITPGDLLATGGTVLQKPDFSAADGVATSVPTFAPFFGTSASAPHAAAIAALLLSQSPSLSSNGFRAVLTSSALDIDTAGADRNSGLGIVMASEALEAATDALWINPGQGFVAKGPFGGPFVPNSHVFTLTNGGTSSLNWTLVNTSSWLNVSAANGTLTAGGAVQNVTANVSASATNLTPGLHQATVWFTNTTTLVGRARQFYLYVQPADYFTERFEVGNDLDFTTFTLTPNESGDFYEICRKSATGLPTPPGGGTTVSLVDDDFAEVTLAGTNTVGIYAQRTNKFFISSNGYLTFNSSDTQLYESFDNHFNLPRVSGLFDDLNPSGGGTISWKQTPDRVAVTFEAVPEFGDSTSTNTFQIELFFDGRISLTYLTVKAADGMAGVSAGQGLPANFLESDFSSYNACPIPMVTVLPASVAEGAGVLINAGEVRLLETLSTNLTVALSSSDTSELSIPSSIVILAGQTNTTFDLTVMDDADLDGPRVVEVVALAPGCTPTTNTTIVTDNETAGLTLNFPAEATEGSVIVSGLVTTTTAPTEDFSVALVSSLTNELQAPAFVVLPAGATSAPVTLSIVDDLRIDGDQSVTLTASVPNWTNAQAIIVVHDNESTNLIVTLLSTAREGNGLIGGAGRVSIAGTLQTNLTVSLFSFDTTEANVPATALISAGQTSTVFSVTIVDDLVLDGTQFALITANAPGFAQGVDSIDVTDDETPLAPVNPSPPHLSATNPVTANLSWNYPPGEGAELVVNGTFETGNLNGWVTVPSGSGNFILNAGTNDPPSPDGPTPAFAGSFSALGQESSPGMFSMYQDVSIPSGATVVTLSWVDRIRNFGASFATNQQFRVEVRATNNTVLAVIFSTNPGDPLLGEWTPRSVNLASYQGQTIRLAFVVHPALQFLDVHLDNISLRSGSPPATSYDVYFGTNPTPGPAELLGNTSLLNWDLPVLAPLTTYYWQVVAKRSGETPGPVWQFTTRGVDRFVWNTIPSPQFMEEPFGVTITAKDEFNTTVTNFTGTVNLTGYVTNGGATNSVLISPLVSASFVNGVWTGQITALQPATNMVLRATDVDGHVGNANALDILIRNDLAVTISDTPDPVIGGSNLIYAILVTNSGPNVADNVVLTNFLPVSVNLGSVTLSQGNHTNISGSVICEFGSLGTGSNATVIIVVNPTLGGTITNRVNVSRNGVESYLLNNSASAVTTVLPAFGITDASIVEGLSGNSQLNFNLSMFPASAQTVQVNFSTTNGTAVAGTDYVATNGVLIFNPGETNRLISVGIIGDRFFESNETFSVSLSAPVGVSIIDGQGLGTIVNDDPLLADIADWNIGEGGLVTFTASNNAAVLGTPFVITDFEAFASGTVNGTVMFRDPRNSVTTVGFLDASPNLTSVTNNFPAGNGSTRALRASWSFSTNGVNPWLRLSTFNTAFLPNPTVAFNQSVRFDIYCDKPLQVAIGLRETSTTAPIGANGGLGGNVEFAGVPAKIGSTPVPSRTVPSNVWTTLQFDLPGEAITNLTGNGILESSTGKGVLEHIALVPAGGLGPQTIYLDNFVVFSNRFIYSLEAGAPVGATIHPISGVFSWRPRESQGPGVYPITVRFSDTTSALFDTETFTVTVIESNSPPVLAAITNWFQNEGSTLTITNSATDPDLPANVLTFSLGTNAPAGAAINPTNGLFTWTPTEAQGPSTNFITVHVVDNGSPNLTHSQTFQVVVTEVNLPPSLAFVPDRTIPAGATVLITNLATDPDLPANLLSFSLETAPLGAMLNSSNGLLTWSPLDTQAGTNSFTIEVSDNGVPILSDIVSFNLVVVSRPLIQSISVEGGTATLVWTSIAGGVYEVQFSEDFDTWTPLTPTVTASGSQAQFIDVNSEAPRFYRILVLAN